MSVEKSLTEEKSDLRVAFTVAAVVIGSLVATLYDVKLVAAHPAARVGIGAISIAILLIVWRAYWLTRYLRTEGTETS